MTADRADPELGGREHLAVGTLGDAGPPAAPLQLIVAGGAELAAPACSEQPE